MDDNEKITEKLRKAGVFDKDRRGKPHDPEFTKLLYDAYGLGKTKRRNNIVKLKSKKKK
jgi:hypothetical protein